MFNPISFFTYIFIMAFTPGPNNIMSMSNASERGFRKSFPFIFGIFIGMLGVLTLCLAFSSALYAFIPQIKFYMTIAGASYMLWLAWGMVKPQKEKEAGTVSKQGLWTGAILQFINAKFYIYGITSLSTYILPYFRNAAALWGFVFLLAFVGFCGSLCWGLFGAVLNSLFKRHNRIINIVMAILLCYCAVSLFL